MTSGTPSGLSAALMARARSSMTPVSLCLVTQLDQGRAAFGQHPREVGEIVAAGALRIDDRIEPHIHRRHVTLPRCRKVSWSRP